MKKSLTKVLARMAKDGDVETVAEIIGEDGPPHERVFTAAVYLEGVETARGRGTSKKRAEQEAAAAALNTLIRSGELGRNAP